MPLRLAAPARQPFNPAWMAVPLILVVIAMGALIFVRSPLMAPVKADAPEEMPSMPAAA